MMLNTIIVFANTIINIVLGLVEIRLFLAKYGSGINGLIQTGNQVLNYMALLESGLCSAYMFYMYKSVAAKNNYELSSLYKGFRLNIQKIVKYMVIAAIAICLIYPLLLKDKDFSYFTVFSIFVLLAAKMIIPYQLSLVSKQMIILKEKKYLVELISGITTAAMYAIEIVIILLTDWPVQVLLLSCIFVLLVSGVIIRVLMNRYYKGIINHNVEANNSPNKMSKDVMVHTLSGLVFGSTDNIILSIFSSLKNVTIYSNYSLISSHAISLSNKLVDGATASLGIKIAHNDKDSYIIFRELFCGVMFLSVLVTATYISMINDFITLWVGEEYCVNNINILLFGGILLCGLVLPCLQALVSASGKFKESKRYIVAQAVANLVITIALVPFLGITGALIGTLAARIFITVPFNYRTVYKDVFSTEKPRWIELVIAPFLVIGICGLSNFIVNPLMSHLNLTHALLSFVVKTLFIALVGFIVSFIYYFFFGYGFKKLLLRLIPWNHSRKN